MTKSRRPDPETPSFDRLPGSVGEDLPGILREIDEAAAFLRGGTRRRPG